MFVYTDYQDVLCYCYFHGSCQGYMYVNTQSWIMLMSALMYIYIHVYY